MKLAALALAILALGIVVGFALAGDASGGPASAAPKCPGPSANCTPTPTATATSTPEPPQQREDQLHLATGEFGAENTDWIFAGAPPAYSLGMDASRYPPSTTFRLEVGITMPANPNNPIGACMRLFDNTAGAPVSGSDTCVSADTAQEVNARVRSDPLALPSELREYAVQVQTPNLAFVQQTRIVAEWTE